MATARCCWARERTSHNVANTSTSDEGCRTRGFGRKGTKDRTRRSQRGGGGCSLGVVRSGGGGGGGWGRPPSGACALGGEGAEAGGDGGPGFRLWLKRIGIAGAIFAWVPASMRAEGNSIGVLGDGEGEEGDLGTDDMFRMKRLLRNTLRDVVRLHERLDDLKEKEGSSSFSPAGGPDGIGGGSQVRASVRGSFIIDEDGGEGLDGPERENRLRQVGIGNESALAVTVTSTPQPGNTLRVELATENPAQGSKLELRKVHLESSISKSAVVKCSPLGGSASDLLMVLHPLLGSGLSSVTRSGSTFLNSCRGILLSGSWTSNSLGASVLHSFHSFTESKAVANRPTHTIGQVLVKVLDNLVVCASTKLSSTYQRLDVEMGSAQKSLGYTHEVSHSLTAAATLSSSVLLSGWATMSHQKTLDEWWVGATNLAGQRNGWGVSISSPRQSGAVQVEAFVKHALGGVELSPGLVYLPASNRKILMLNAQV
ncbi:hypothetical protein HOP50_01g09330 [Chloropicon primus]|uniref:Uncharacterized protein n=1 Tax=Chloropicon primus TaxID=1764295 RepID=A0A5B8MCY9_9CHLO|nr:hypothetical protein A3770_01p09460 [Chloropicon primus]UPQ97638.1 hypothetical protein HOP50_01g09330 [Chloropicon primus]|eukprot:QDZ18428.1 hypothetical protein A3770_01p09460 [Chloropicon primus]